MTTPTPKIKMTLVAGTRYSLMTEKGLSEHMFLLSEDTDVTPVVSNEFIAIYALADGTEIHVTAKDEQSALDAYWNRIGKEA